MNTLIKSESAMFVSLMCSLLPEDCHLEPILDENRLKAPYPRGG